MARLPRRAPAPAPLRGAAMPPSNRSLYAHLSAGLARLPRPSAAWLPLSAPAWLRQVLTALLRLLRRRDKGPAVPGPQGGGADEGEITAASGSAPGGNDAAAPVGAGAPTGKRARRRPGETPTGPKTQGGDVGEGPSTAASGSAPGGNDAAVLGRAGVPSGKKARRRHAETPTGLGPQGGDAGEGTSHAASDSAPASNDTAGLSGSEAQKPEAAAKNSLLTKEEEAEGSSHATNPGTLQKQEAEGASHAFTDDSTWEVAKRRKRCRPNIDAQVPPATPKAKCCTYCNGDGHSAKDCPRTKASVNLSTGCDRKGKGHCRKSEDGDEGNCSLKKQRFAKDKEEAEREAHWMYRFKPSSCKKDEILCLACHLQGKVVPIQNDYDVMKLHFKNKHRSHGTTPHGTPCEAKGCLARAENKHDIGMHQHIIHGS